MTFREADRMVRHDGWFLESAEGSHYHYKHDRQPPKTSKSRLATETKAEFTIGK